MRSPIATAAQQGNEAAQAWMELAEEFNEPTLLTIDDFDKDFVLKAHLASVHFTAPWPPALGDFERALGY